MSKFGDVRNVEYATRQAADVKRPLMENVIKISLNLVFSDIYLSVVTRRRDHSPHL